MVNDNWTTIEGIELNRYYLYHRGRLIVDCENYRCMLLCSCEPAVDSLFIPITYHCSLVCFVFLSGPPPLIISLYKPLAACHSASMFSVYYYQEKKIQQLEFQLENVDQGTNPRHCCAIWHGADY